MADTVGHIEGYGGIQTVDYLGSAPSCLSGDSKSPFYEHAYQCANRGNVIVLSSQEVVDISIHSAARRGLDMGAPVMWHKHGVAPLSTSEMY